MFTIYFMIVVFGLILLKWGVEEVCHPNPFDSYYSLTQWEQIKSYFCKKEKLVYRNGRGFGV